MRRKNLFLMCLIACSSMMFLQFNTKVSASEIEDTFWVSDYEDYDSIETNQEPVLLSIQDLTFKDENGRVVDIDKQFEYSYTYGEKLYPKFDIYYQDMKLGCSSDESYWGTNYFSNSFYKLNPLTGNYEYFTSSEYDCNESGTYQMVLTMRDAEVYETDEMGNFVECIYRLQDTITVNFTITNLKDISTLEFNEIKNYTYTGKKITPTVKVKDGNTVLKKNKDYHISYVNNKKYGEASIVITGMGDYVGEKILYFGIVSEKVTNIKVSSPKKLQAKITWEKSKGADGYLIERYNTKKEEYETIGILKDGNWQVFEDGDDSLKNNQKYKYRITPFVLSEYSDDYYLGKSATKSGKVTKDYKELNLPILTGNVDVDYAAEVICNKIIKKKMTQQEKVRAIYDWVVDNCTHDKNYNEHEIVYDYAKNAEKAQAYSEKMWKKIYKGEAECNFDGVDYSYDGYENKTLPYGDVDGYGQFDRTCLTFQTHQGGCSYITRLFKVLVNHVGIECTLVEGNYLNTRGESMFHVWSYIRVDKKYAWYDVDVATSNKRVRNTWYKKDAKFWKTCHQWDADTVPRGVPSSLN